jgi:hypothetical protein
MLNHEKVKELFDYNPNSGLLTWRIAKSSRIKIGMKAGSKQSLQVKIDGKMYLVSRVIWFYMTGEWPTKLIDHENRIRTDNKWANLREATYTQNNINSRARRNRKYKYPTGIKLHSTGKFQARFCQKHLGTFINLEDAIKARQKYLIDNHFRAFIPR